MEIILNVRQRIEAILQLSSGEWVEFADPARIVVAESVSAVRPALAEVERLTRDLGLHAAGFLTYEAGQAFDLPVRTLGDSLPLAWFGLFEPKGLRLTAQPAREGEYRLGPLRPSIHRKDFERAFDAIKGHLAAGDTYQVNFTFKMKGEFEGEPRALFADLIEARGIAGMREAISNTAELGAALGGPRVVDDHVRTRMREVLDEVRSGRFARVLSEEAAQDYPRLKTARARAQALAVERALLSLKS